MTPLRALVPVLLLAAAPAWGQNSPSDCIALACRAVKPPSNVPISDDLNGVYLKLEEPSCRPGWFMVRIMDRRPMCAKEMKEPKR